MHFIFHELHHMIIESVPYFLLSLPVSCFSTTSPISRHWYHWWPCTVLCWSVRITPAFTFAGYLQLYVGKKGLRWGRRAKLLECQDKWLTRPVQACGINFCCPSLLLLCCQGLFGLLKWSIFSLVASVTSCNFSVIVKLVTCSAVWDEKSQFN